MARSQAVRLEACQKPGTRNRQGMMWDRIGCSVLVIEVCSWSEAVSLRGPGAYLLFGER